MIENKKKVEQVAQQRQKISKDRRDSPNSSGQGTEQVHI